MAEVAERGWNVAVPEVDLGDDLLLLDDATGDIKRIQVKTARARRTTRGLLVKFKFGRAQLFTPRSPELVYVLVIRQAARWGPFVVIRRDALAREHRDFGVGGACDRGRAILVALELHGRATLAHTSRVHPWPDRDFARFVDAWESDVPRLSERCSPSPRSAAR